MTEGLRTLEWTYIKDVYSEDGQDCAWVDNIKFPPTAVIVDVKEVVATDVDVYPNPSAGVFKLQLGDIQSEIVVYNAMGQVVYRHRQAPYHNLHGSNFCFPMHSN